MRSLFIENRMSNPKELIQDTCYMAANLPAVWDSWNYYDKQNFQNTLFPLGVIYDTKKEEVRTEKVNSVFGYAAHLSRTLLKLKSRFPHDHSEENGSVPCTLKLSNFIEDFNRIRKLRAFMELKRF